MRDEEPWHEERPRRGERRRRVDSRHEEQHRRRPRVVNPKPGDTGRDESRRYDKRGREEQRRWRPKVVNPTPGDTNREHLRDARLDREHLRDARLAKFLHLSGPETILEPSIFQMFPENWQQGHDCPCYMGIGNWIDPTTSQFVTQNNIQVVIKASGSNPKNGDKPPLSGYGINVHTGCQPYVFICPINHRRSVVDTWLMICKTCIRMWAEAESGKPPPMAFVHCNEGINRAPALFALLAAKFQGCQPSWPARVLAENRHINAMYHDGVEVAQGRDLKTWSLMHAVVEMLPLSVQFREASLFDEREGLICAYVPFDEQVPHYYRPRVSPKVRLTPAFEVANLSSRVSTRHCAASDIRGFATLTNETRGAPSTQEQGRVPPSSAVEHDKLCAQPLRVNYDSSKWVDFYDDGVYGCQPYPYMWPLIGSELQNYLKRKAPPRVAFHGRFDFNLEGRHVLHQLAEDFRHPEQTFSKTLWVQAMWATYRLLKDGLNLRTVGRHPRSATVLSMACKQGWKAKGCQPRDQVHMVEQLLEWGCDPDLVSNRGDTVLMDVAGAGHVNMFKYWYGRIAKQLWTCDLEVVNQDGWNLCSIAGLAHDKDERPHVNPYIKAMVGHLVELEYMRDEGLATHSGAARAKKPRIEHQPRASRTLHTEDAQDVEAASPRSCCATVIDPQSPGSRRIGSRESCIRSSSSESWKTGRSRSPSDSRRAP